MNFYAAQDNAKKKTKYLVLLYVLILIVLTFLSTLVLMLVLPVVTGQSLATNFWQTLFTEQNLPTLLWVGAFVVGGALISSFVKSRHLAKGGAVIAAALGGSKLSPNSSNMNERKALNVVEEMAIASGMPVPEVFVLRQESAINAFAAGQTPQDAVIGLTQGCIDKLSRTQLQGVVGHEFSHILNGDMRLNLRIIMLLHGIEFIALLGRIMTSSRGSSRSSSRSKGKGNGAIVLAGIALRVIGWFGILFGNMLQAAVSRQREFLADASSVQFTRDPDAIAGALKVIGGVTETSRLKNTEVSEVAHLFFGQSFHTRLAFLFATHPPIDMRILRIQPGWNGEFLKPQTVMPVESEPGKDDRANTPFQNLPEPLAMLLGAGVLIDQLTDNSQNALGKLVGKAQDPLEAIALVIAILLCEESDNPQEKTIWKTFLAESSIKGLESMVKEQVELILLINLANRLPLVELAMPALKTLSANQYQDFKQLLHGVMDSDRHQSIFEQSVFQLVTRFLDVHFGLVKAPKVRYKNAKQIAMELQLILSTLAYYGQNSDEANKTSMDLAFKRAVTALGLNHLQRIEIDDSHQNLFRIATEKLLYCSEVLKHQVVSALVVCVEHDGQVNEVEKELVLAIAATMNAPIPRLSL
ncbi:M48 family metallopeptidase [Thiomicrorhabdus lithotrophica]|uniref:M48 family metallopeptidase n=1 Tax=Thiomicrorhabdus lithotrophica TaxID=2949997 RepID=A0ABY8C7Z0_9GAMM|nr:M48 family metallopeptidase [Thiomicrorhabdus lithotrophica]WEJ62079.1 M48 family metallopeptidase [Thiomicrorhabdus lithotrophica]